MSERDEDKAIMLARCNPNMSIAEIASDLNTALGAHQVSQSTISKLMKKKHLNSYLATKKMVQRESRMDCRAMEKSNFLGQVKF